MKNKILSLDPPPRSYSTLQFLDACSSNRDAALQSWGGVDASSSNKDAVFLTRATTGGSMDKGDFLLFFSNIENFWIFDSLFLRHFIIDHSLVLH